MISMYSKRLLLPYVGVLQIAELGRARALSADGTNWAIQYIVPRDIDKVTNGQINKENSNVFMVATIANGELKTHSLHSVLDVDEVGSVIDQLYRTLMDASVPFAAADCYEYWLLDHTDKQPLALLQSTVYPDDMSLPPPQPSWVAMPAAQLEVIEPDAKQDCYVPPVNYRLQTLIEERAGAKPRAAWFRRNDPATDDFPPCLIREDWASEEQQQICDLYIHRLAPRLLMMHGLSRSTRTRLEECASQFAFDVERFYMLYPEVIDEKLMNAARVEAQLRRANPVDGE